MDTLEFFPHNYPVPEIFCVELLLIADQYMTDALNHPHQDVPFSKIVDYTIPGITTLKTIFTKKLNNPPVQAITKAPKSAENKQTESLVQPILTSSVKHKPQSRLQTRNKPSSPSNVFDSQNLSQPPRVVTPATRGTAPPRVPAQELNLSPRNLFHKDFLDMGSSNQEISLGGKYWTRIPIMNAVLHPVMVK